MHMAHLLYSIFYEFHLKLSLCLCHPLPPQCMVAYPLLDFQHTRAWARIKWEKRQQIWMYTLEHGVECHAWIEHLLTLQTPQWCQSANMIYLISHSFEQFWIFFWGQTFTA